MQGMAWALKSGNEETFERLSTRLVGIMDDVEKGVDSSFDELTGILKTLAKSDAGA